MTNLERIRKERGFTVEQLAERLFETGKYATLDTAINAIQFSEGTTVFYQITEISDYVWELAGALTCSVDELLEE